jgi:hypothetical protein
VTVTVMVVSEGKNIGSAEAPPTSHNTQQAQHQQHSNQQEIGNKTCVRPRPSRAGSWLAMGQHISIEVADRGGLASRSADWLV